MQDFISSTGVDGLRHVSDEAGDIWSEYGIASQPAWVFINDDGTATSLVSTLGENGLTSEIESLLAS